MEISFEESQPRYNHEFSGYDEKMRARERKEHQNNLFSPSTRQGVWVVATK
jgi:hypothetical protein